MPGHGPQHIACDVSTVVDFRIVLDCHANPLLGCATTPPIVATPPIVEMAWVRTDGRMIADNPALLQEGKTDIAACNANLDTGSPTEAARGCMAQKGYVLVRRDQAEDVRASYAAGAQRDAPNR